MSNSEIEIAIRAASGPDERVPCATAQELLDFLLRLREENPASMGNYIQFLIPSVPAEIAYGSSIIAKAVSIENFEWGFAAESYIRLEAELMVEEG